MKTPTALEFEEILHQRSRAGILPPTTSLFDPQGAFAVAGIDADAVVSAGDAALAQPIVAPRFSDYLPYEQRGSRKEADKALGGFLARLSTLAMAEVAEGGGRFIEELQDAIFAACEITSWIMVAHCRALPEGGWRDGSYKSGDPLPDLSACMTAARFAVILHLLGEKLHPLIRERMAFEVERRVFRPLDSDQPWWIFGNNNWNGVCAGGTLIAALALMKDVRRKAVFAQRMTASLRHFLDAAFEEDGTCTEGIGYWGFGMSWFTLAADALKRVTGGDVDLFSHAKLPRIAVFPARADLGDGTFPSFSDCGMGRRASPVLLNYYARLLNEPELAAMARDERDSSANRNSIESFALTWMASELPPAPKRPARHTGLCGWLPVSQWLVAREKPNSVDGLVLAAKGGHNDEPHNHNDIGSFAVYLDGDIAIADPGNPPYDRWFFTEKRYQYLLAGSQGHSVPAVNGHFQRPGRAAHAGTLNHDESPDTVTLSLEMAAAYPAGADLVSLKRTFEYNRAQPTTVLLTDEATFTKPDNTWESRLVSLHPWSIQDNRATTLAGCLRVETAADNLTLEQQAEPCTIAGIGDTHLHILRVTQHVDRRQGTIAVKITG